MLKPLHDAREDGCCATCIYSDDSEGKAVMICRRHPPRLIRAQDDAGKYIETDWPRVADFEFCGDGLFEVQAREP